MAGEGLARLYDTASGQAIGAADAPSSGRVSARWLSARTAAASPQRATTDPVWKEGAWAPPARSGTRSPESPYPRNCRTKTGSRHLLSCPTATHWRREIMTHSFISGMPPPVARRGTPLAQSSIVLSLAISPDGLLLAAGTAERAQWRHQQSPVLGPDQCKPHGDPIRFGNWVTGIIFNSQGTKLIAGANDATAQLIDVATCRPIGELLRHDRGITAMAFQPDGDLVLTGSGSDTRLWYSRTGLPASPLITSSSHLSALAFHRDGRFFAIGYLRMARSASMRSPRPNRSALLRNLRDKVLGLTFSLDGRSLIALDVCGDVRTWVLPEPASGPPELLAKRLQARSGMELDADHEIVYLSPKTWRLRRDELGEPGGLTRQAADLDEHEAAARDAERIGLAFAARWHLDRLIAARPDDGMLYARRAGR